jgi:subtilisin family serine protease
MRRSDAALGVIAAFAWAASAGAVPRIDPGVAARAEAGERVRVLVELAVPFAPEGGLTPSARGAQRGRIATAQASLGADLAGTPHRVVRAFRAIPFAALEAEAAAVVALARSPRVVAVTPDDLHAPLLDVSVPLVQADQTRALGFDGAGQTVAVIDTGVDAVHPNLVGKIVGEACFASGSPGPSGDCPNGDDSQSGAGAGTYCTWSSECFHGTHVAGIAAGEGPSYDGVAPGATLVSIQVFSEITSSTQCSPSPAPCARAYESDVLAALEEVYDVFRFEHTIPAVNLSLGGQTYTSQSACDADNAAYKAAIDNLRSVDVATVIAAGNNGLSNGLADPACISTAVSVSATGDTDTIPSWANRASFLSLWAPGNAIRAPYYGTSQYANASGTSMAAPHVAGAWAILRGAVPEAGVAEILLALQTTGVPIVYTTRIRIRDALDELTVACDNGLDDDGDGLVDLADPGCSDAADDSELGSVQCDDALDNDGDGYFDFPDDPGCKSLSANLEQPQCQDGIDNDGDGRVDFDGGASLNGGIPLDDPDLTCAGDAWRNREASGGSCGLGFELAPLLAALRSRRRRA